MLGKCQTPTCHNLDTIKVRHSQNNTLSYWLCDVCANKWLSLGYVDVTPKPTSVPHTFTMNPVKTITLPSASPGNTFTVANGGSSTVIIGEKGPEIVTWPNSVKWKAKECECGSESVGSSRHSSWCPVYKEET